MPVILNEKKMSLEVIRRALRLVQEAGIDVSRAFWACDAVAGAGYENVWVWKKKRSTSHNTAEVVVRHDSERMSAWLYVCSKCGQMLKKALIAEEQPSEFGLYRHLGSLDWDGDTVVVSSEYGFRLEVPV